MSTGVQLTVRFDRERPPHHYPCVGELARIGCFSVWPLPELCAPLWTICSGGHLPAGASGIAAGEGQMPEEVWRFVLQLQTLLDCGWPDRMGVRGIAELLETEILDLGRVLKLAVDGGIRVMLDIEPTANTPEPLVSWLGRERAGVVARVREALTEQADSREQWESLGSDSSSSSASIEASVPEEDDLDTILNSIPSQWRSLFDVILFSAGRRGWNAYSYGCITGVTPSLPSLPALPKQAVGADAVPVVIELSGADFSGMDLSGLDLSLARVERCCFDEADLTAASIASAVGASFRGATLTATDFRSACITGADFRGAHMVRSRFLYACYEREAPPKGLSLEQLEICTIMPD